MICNEHANGCILRIVHVFVIKYLIPSIAGIFSSPITTDDYISRHRKQQGRRLLRFKRCFLVYVYGFHYHMGSTQQLCFTSHCIP